MIIQERVVLLKINSNRFQPRRGVISVEQQYKLYPSSVGAIY
jgi:hypothetical protein